jgi:hypothetical protein
MASSTSLPRGTAIVDCHQPRWSRRGHANLPNKTEVVHLDCVGIDVIGIGNL